MSIANIKSSLEARFEALNTTFTKLSYQLKVEDNKFKGNNKGYAINPKSASEVETVLGFFIMDQVFEFTLTNGYTAGAKSQLGDDLKVSRVAELMDVILTTYKDITNKNIAVESSVILISQLEIQDPEFIEESDVITQKFNIIVKYRTQV